MSTVSYLRFALGRAEHRAAKYETKLGELTQRVEKTGLADAMDDLERFKRSHGYTTSKQAVVNLRRALESEERRLAFDPLAKL